MNSNEFEKRMRTSEWFHTLRCLPGAWVVLRLDGRGFTKFTEREGFEKPFDFRFQELMRQTAQALLQELQVDVAQRGKIAIGSYGRITGAIHCL